MYIEIEYTLALAAENFYIFRCLCILSGNPNKKG